MMMMMCMMYMMDTRGEAFLLVVEQHAGTTIQILQLDTTTVCKQYKYIIFHLTDYITSIQTFEG